MRRRAVQEPAAGFSLVEVLLALALLGLVMGLVTQSMAFGVRVWERERAAGTGIDLVLARLGAILEAAPLPAVRRSAFSAERPIRGGARELRVLSYDGGEGLVLWHLAIERRSTGLALVGRRGPVARPDAALGRWVPDRVAFEIRGLDEAGFAYAGDAGPAIWRPEWPAAARAPALVRLRLVRGATARTMVVHIREAR